MKVTIRETDYQMSIHITPETLEEVGALFRFSNNYKKQSPDVYMSFSQYNTNQAPYCNIRMEKVSVRKQITGISNKKS